MGGNRTPLDSRTSRREVDFSQPQGLARHTYQTRGFFEFRDLGARLANFSCCVKATLFEDACHGREGRQWLRMLVMYRSLTTAHSLWVSRHRHRHIYISGFWHLACQRAAAPKTTKGSLPGKLLVRFQNMKSCWGNSSFHLLFFAPAASSAAQISIPTT